MYSCQNDSKCENLNSYLENFAIIKQKHFACLISLLFITITFVNIFGTVIWKTLLSSNKNILLMSYFIIIYYNHFLE